MAKTLYKAKFENRLPLGGIATGHITLGCDGSFSLPLNESSNLSFFAIKAEKDGQFLDARVLQSSKKDGVSLSPFEKTHASSFFPFSEICFCDSTFPADVKMLVFSPFIPLNDTDSGIPAVCFEFEITNKSSERIDFSIVCASENSNENAFNRMGCSDTGEAYIYLSGLDENSRNSCIATNAKNVSFCEYTSFGDDFTKNFTKNPTLYNKTKAENPGHFAGGALCTHFSLGENQSTKAVFCLSWYNSENEFSRNYYAQYFESSLECASYLFRQKERLYKSSFEFCENVLGATISENILEEINKDLFSLIGKEILRLDDGTLMTDEKNVFSDMEGFISRSDALTSLFPTLEYSNVLSFYKSAQYKKAKDEDIVLAILKSYRKYILSADVDALIEDWYYIVKCIEQLYGEDGKAKCRADDFLQAALMEAATAMAQAVKDKKRHEMYSEKLSQMPLCQWSMDMAQGFAKINEMSGFSYNAVEKHIEFNPMSDKCPLDTGGTFRCFFCTPTCYGYVEEGIDYIEINLLCGSLTLRSFGVPRIPRLVGYGGRNWRFENKNLTAVLDCDLEVTPQKKLTIFIDIKQ